MYVLNVVTLKKIKLLLTFITNITNVYLEILDRCLVSLVIGALVAQWVKFWPIDLADRV